MKASSKKRLSLLEARLEIAFPPPKALEKEGANSSS